MNRVQPAVMKERRLAKRKLATAAAPVQPETQYLARVSNADHSSEESLNPVQHNEGRMGSYGYNGFPQSNPSQDTFATRYSQPQPVKAEPWSIQETHGYPPANYDNPYSQNASYYTPDDSSSQSHHSKVATYPPQIDNVSNLTGPRRTGREGTDTTVGMGSWGGILKEGSDASTQQQQQPRRDGVDEYGMMGKTGLSALGAPMTGAGTVSVTPHNVSAARQSVQQPGMSVRDKSMRAVVERSDDSDLSYTQASPPNNNNGYLGQNMATPTAASFSHQQRQ